MPTGPPTTLYAIPTFADVDVPDLGNLGGGGLTSILQAIDTAIGAAKPATSSTPSTKATSSTTFVMAGFAGSITPTKSGVVRVTIDGYYTNATGGNQGQIQLAYGTAIPPHTGDAPTGTVQGPALNLTSTSSEPFPYSLTRLLTGLTRGTAYWLDGQIASPGGTSSSFVNTNITAVEE